MLWEFMKWSLDGKSFDQQTNSLNRFFKEMYGDQSGEFVFGYWGLQRWRGGEKHAIFGGIFGQVKQEVFLTFKPNMQLTL